MIMGDCNSLFDSGAGCAWNGSTCAASGAYTDDCMVFDDFEYACGETDACNYDTDECVAVPTCETATSDNCALCNSDSDMCGDIEGCSYNESTTACTASPAYADNGDCTSFDGYPMDCVADSNCAAYNVNTNDCLATAPEVNDGSVTCSTLNYFEDACNDVDAATGNGSANLGCAFNMSTTLCVDVTAFSADTDSCSDL